MKTLNDREDYRNHVPRSAFSVGEWSGEGERERERFQFSSVLAGTVKFCAVKYKSTFFNVIVYMHHKVHSAD